MKIDINKIKGLDLVLTAHEMSTSGKYAVFFGEHYVKGIPCYDVGAFNGVTCELHRRHFGEDKPGAMIYYDEFRNKMTEGGTKYGEEEDKYVVL